MYLRNLLSGTLALILLSVTAARSSERAETEAPRPAIGLPGVFGSGGTEQPIHMAQAADPRTTALEEQIRALNGTVEELNFQILQMQEQIRKMQEDNEFRFQELEKRSGAAGSGSPAVASAPEATQGGEAAGAPSGVEEIIAGSGQAEADAPAAGEPATTLGTLTVDADGNIKNSGGAADSGGNDTAVASLPSTSTPNELYRNSYEFILSGDYSAAEAGFRDHVERYPDDAKAADVRFWLGESLLGQGKYREAAEVFLAASKDYPKSKKGPDILLKLGISLAGLNQREVACATFGEIGKRYPQVSGALRERVKQEQALAAC